MSNLKISKEELIEKMSIAFSNKQNQSNGRKILSAWCDMSEEIKDEIRIAMKDALQVAINGDGLLAYKFIEPIEGRVYLSRNGLVILFTKAQAEKWKSVLSHWKGELVEYVDYYPTILDDAFLI
jgi:hypothetical protein